MRVEKFFKKYKVLIMVAYFAMVAVVTIVGGVAFYTIGDSPLVKGMGQTLHEWLFKGMAIAFFALAVTAAYLVLTDEVFVPKDENATD
ncbi:MAG: hypothetical protein AAB355_00790 [Patescibacteria group bacterium]